jgi:hypothetical protein
VETGVKAAFFDNTAKAASSSREDSREIGSSNKIPSGLPKFRGKTGIEDPEEFVDQFQQICRAHDVVEKRYCKLLPLCLDSIDNRWLD